MESQLDRIERLLARQQHEKALAAVLDKARPELRPDLLVFGLGRYDQGEDGAEAVRALIERPDSPAAIPTAPEPKQAPAAPPSKPLTVREAVAAALREQGGGS